MVVASLMEPFSSNRELLQLAKRASVEPPVRGRGPLSLMEALSANGAVPGGHPWTGPFVTMDECGISSVGQNDRTRTCHYAALWALFGDAAMSGPNVPDLSRRPAAFAVKIFNGAKPSDLPIEQPTGFELAINLKTAKALGLGIPPTVIALADEVIE